MLKSLDEGGKYAQLAHETIRAMCAKDVEKLKRCIVKDANPGCYVDSNLWLRGPLRLTGGDASEIEFEERMIFGYFADGDENFSLNLELISTKLISEYGCEELTPISASGGSESGSIDFSKVHGIARLLISHPAMEAVKQEIDFEFFAMFYEGLVAKLSIFVNPSEYALLVQKFNSG